MFRPDDRRGAIDQHRIVEHQELCVEQVRVLGAGGSDHPFLDVLELLARLRARRIEPRDLDVDAVFRDPELQVPRPARHHQRASDPDSRRDAEAVQAHGDLVESALDQRAQRGDRVYFVRPVGGDGDGAAFRRRRAGAVP